eukprot:15299990-Ditylum_brightwellii.AAC.2
MAAASPGAASFRVVSPVWQQIIWSASSLTALQLRGHLQLSQEVALLPRSSFCRPVNAVPQI